MWNLPEAGCTTALNRYRQPMEVAMSDDRAEEIKKNILSPSQWTRIIFMAVYGVAWWIVTIVLVVIVVLQALISLVTGTDNVDLRKFGTILADYLRQLLGFMLYASNEKPWPFSTGTDDVDDHDDGPATTASNDAAAEPEAAQAAATDSVPPTDMDDQGGVPERNEPDKPLNRDDVFSDMSFTDQEDDRDQSAEDSDRHSVDFPGSKNSSENQEDPNSGGEPKPSL
jgi:hypothetical protein